jgi:hypothetical protein
MYELGKDQPTTTPQGPAVWIVAGSETFAHSRSAHRADPGTGSRIARASSGAKPRCSEIRSDYRRSVRRFEETKQHEMRGIDVRSAAVSSMTLTRAAPTMVGINVGIVFGVAIIAATRPGYRARRTSKRGRKRGGARVEPSHS